MECAELMVANERKYRNHKDERSISVWKGKILSSRIHYEQIQLSTIKNSTAYLSSWNESTTKSQESRTTKHSS